MDRVCNFILENVNSSNDNKELSYSTMEDGAEMDMTIPEQCQILNDIMGSLISNLETFEENFRYQRKVIISFVYNGRKCNILEHYDTQRDYLCLRVEK